MRPDPITLTLGGASFTLRPFTLAQHQEISRALHIKDADDPVRGPAAILAAALRRDYPAQAADGEAIECDSIDEFRAAVSAILHFGGYLKAVAPGEAEAAEVTA